MKPLRHIPRYTLNDYRQWEGRWELIDGLAYAMSPSPNKKHQMLASIILVQIGAGLEALKSKCGDCIQVHELDWIIDDNNVVRPDIAIICDKTGDFITSAPALIIEILSPATALKDKQVKFEIYQEQGVPYYLLADPAAMKFEIYCLTEGAYKQEQNLKEFVIHNNCTININLEKALANLAN